VQLGEISIESGNDKLFAQAAVEQPKQRFVVFRQILRDLHHRHPVANFHVSSTTITTRFVSLRTIFDREARPIS
jgi:hypothetical protein